MSQVLFSLVFRYINIDMCPYGCVSAYVHSTLLPFLFRSGFTIYRISDFLTYANYADTNYFII